MPHRNRVLVVDDDSHIRTSLASRLQDAGYAVETAADGFKALPKLDEFKPDVLLTELAPIGLDGFALMRRSEERDPDRPVVLMTADATVSSAVAAMRAGAADYLIKPIDHDRLLRVLERALELRHERAARRLIEERPAPRGHIDNIVGESPAMRRVYDAILTVARSRASVIITGESGTGKELVAAAIHEHSPRAAAPFVKVHCASLVESLLESELFGHERGAFTGADSSRDGRFQQADGGTLFLDEIADIPLGTQTKLLRFLQQREFERVGGNRTHKVDIRILAATNRDLIERVKSGRFREDLYYRLNVVTIEVPPLRERRSDIPLLASFFLRRAAAEEGRELQAFSDAALERLMMHDWPGNVRELQNAVERAAITTRQPVIDAGDLSESIGAHHSRRATLPPIPGAPLAELERYAILATLEHSGGSPSKAARLLDISTRKVQYKVREYRSPVDEMTAAAARHSRGGG